MNIYTNAFYALLEKSIEAGATFKPLLVITTKKIAEGLSISIKDNGNGVPAGVAEKIFQPFFTTKPPGKGTGLGLSLSYDIIKSFGGDIKMNTAEGTFAEFIIIIPLLIE